MISREELKRDQLSCEMSGDDQAAYLRTDSKILIVPNAVLNTMCEKIEDFESIQKDIDLIQEIFLNTKDANLGLAAPQIGISKAFFIMRENLDSKVSNLEAKPIKVIINPEIIKVLDKVGYYKEACLSVPNAIGVVQRYKKIKVKYTDRTGKVHKEWLTGSDAIVFQHEFNHLVGRTLLEDAAQIFEESIKDEQKETTAE